MRMPIALFVLCLIQGGANVSALTLVEKGQPSAVIAVKAAAPKVTAFAAKELQEYLRKVTGAMLPLVEIEEGTGPNLQTLSKSANVIAVGENQLTAELGLSSDKMKPDAYRIVCRPKALALFGKDDAEVDPAKWSSIGSAGTLYGVHRFLESLGVRWFFPGEIGEVIPKCDTVFVPDDMDITSAPYFPFRLMEPPLKTPEAGLWMRRIGFGASVDPAATCHSFNRWYDKYSKTNPEYFALHGDKRIKYICYYGKGVREQMIQDAKAYLSKADPKKYPYFTIMENDGAPGPCECPECKKRLTPEQGWYGLMSDYNVGAATDVAKAIRDEFPDRGICIGAYNEYTRPPIHCQQLPPNVGVQIFRHRQQIWSEEAGKNIYDVIEGWLALKPKTVSFWDYYNFDCWAGGRWLGIPAVTTRFIADDIKRLKALSERSGTKFLGEMTFCDGRASAHHQDRLWWLGLDQYLTAKFLWNPDASREELLKDFYTNFFGPAASAMEKFYSRAEEVWMKGDHGGRNAYCAKDVPTLDAMSKAGYVRANPWKCLFTQSVLKELADDLAQARAQAKDTPYRERVEMVSQGFEFTQARAAERLR